MEGIFFEIAIIISVAATIAILFRFLKLPSLFAYMLTGILLGPFHLIHFQNIEALKHLGEVGITLLLFMLGLELKVKDLKSIGKTAVLAGTLQMAVTFILGFLVSMGLGFSPIAGVYIGLALSFSSTIVIVKLLSDKKDLNSLHGKLAIGILLIQDFFAILSLIFLSNPISFDQSFIVDITIIILKLIVLFGWMLVASEYIFPRLLPKLSGSSESLFLFSLGWVFAVTAFVASPFIGFSLEIGGFLAGLALANTHENYQILARMKALRDFFITIFFVTLGLDVTFSHLTSYLVPASILLFFILLVKPTIVAWIIGLMGFRKRTSFFVGVSFAQISEFSLLLLFIGKQKGVFSAEIVSMIILVSMVAFIISTYLIQKGQRLYTVMEMFLFIPEHKKGNHIDLSTEDEFGHFKEHVVIIGGHQMGQSIIHAMKNMDEQLLVVDFNPDIVKKLRAKNIPVLFGDISDPEIQEKSGFEKAKLVVSTVGDVEDNLMLLEGIKHQNKKATVVVVALEGEDARDLYKAGADYVVLPHLAGGHHLAKMLVDKKHLEMIEKYKAKDMEYIS